MSSPEESNFIHSSKNVPRQFIVKESVLSQSKNVSLVCIYSVLRSLSTLLFAYKHWKASLDGNRMLICLNHFPDLESISRSFFPSVISTLRFIYWYCRKRILKLRMHNGDWRTCRMVKMVTSYMTENMNYRAYVNTSFGLDGSVKCC